MALSGNALGDAILAAVNAQAGRNPATETIAQYRQRIERARASALVTYLVANAQITVAPTVAFPIAVSVVPATGLGATTATGASSDTNGTLR
jgi:hypothetical protein